MTLSNGLQSPMFSAPSKDNLSDFKTFLIDDSSHVRRIQGTKNGFNARQVIFKAITGTEIGRIESSNQNIGEEHTINDGD